MEMEKTNNGEKLYVKLAGEIDAVVANEIEKELLTQVEDIKELIFDLEKLEYVSSAGLRVFLAMQKRMKTQGYMEIKNTNEEVMHIFNISGFTRLLNIV